MSANIFLQELYPKMFLANHRLWDPIKCDTRKNHGGIRLIFCLQVNIRIFYRLVALLLVGIAKLAQSTQNNKFPISL